LPQMEAARQKIDRASSIEDFTSIIEPQPITLLSLMKKEGFLEKQEGSLWKKKWYELRDGILFEYTVKRKKLKQMLPISQCTLHDNTIQQEDEIHALFLDNPLYPLLLRMSTELEFHDWTTMFTKHKLLTGSFVERLNNEVSVSEVFPEAANFLSNSTDSNKPRRVPPPNRPPPPPPSSSEKPPLPTSEKPPLPSKPPPKKRSQSVS